MLTSEAIKLYVAARQGELGAKTLRDAEGTLRRLPDLDLSEHTPETLRAWRANLRDRRGALLDRDSANTYFKRVRAFFNFAEKSGWITGNPARLVDPLLPNPKKRVRLRLDQMTEMVIGARHPRDRALIMLATELLLRASEIALLRVGDVRFADGMIDVRIMKKRGIFVDDEMPISGALAHELRAWFDAYRQAAGVLHDDDYLFPNLVTRREGTVGLYRLSPSEPCAKPQEVVKLAMDRVGVVAARRGVHDVRRSMARLRYDALCEQKNPDPIGVIKALLHHESRRQTEHYIGIDAARTRRNEAMRESGWLSVLPVTSDVDVPALPGLATVTRLRP